MTPRQFINKWRNSTLKESAASQEHFIDLCRLVELRDAWLNPPELVKREPEVVPGYPDRLLPVDDQAAAELKKRTLTNLYNLRPAWLANAHRALDEAVATAYGWEADVGDDEILKRLLEMNHSRHHQ